MNLGEINSTTTTTAAISKWFAPHILSFEESLEVNMNVLSSLYCFDNGFISHYVLETPCITPSIRVFLFFCFKWLTLNKELQDRTSFSFASERLDFLQKLIWARAPTSPSMCCKEFVHVAVVPSWVNVP